MKKVTALILALLMMTASFAGCGANPAPAQPASTSVTSSTSAASSATPEAPKGPNAEITVWVWPDYDDFGNLFSEQVQKELNEKYPNIKLNVEQLTPDGGPEKETVAMATGATPDILADGSYRLNPAISGGLTEPLSDIAEELNPVLFDGILEDYTGKDGVINAIPYTMANGYNLSVNTTLAKELGVYDLLPADKVHWSYDQYLAFCRAAAKAGKSKGVYATQLYAGSQSSDSAYFSLFMTAGANILDDAHTKITINSPEAFKGMNLLKTLIDEKLVPDGAATTKDVDGNNNFFSKKIVMHTGYAGAQMAVLVHNKIKSGEIQGPFDVEFYQFPSPDGKAEPRAVNWGTSAFIVFKNKNDADKIEAAKRTIATFMSNPKYSEEVALKRGTSPIVNNAKVDFGDTTINQLTAMASEFNLKYSSSGMGILEPWWVQVRAMFYPEMQAFFTGQKTAEQALGDFQKAGNDIIAKATKK